MSFKIKIAIARLVIVNVVPVIGILLLEWKPGNVMIMYFFDLFAVFVALSINNLYLDPVTRYPFIPATAMLVLSSIPIIAVLVFQGSVLLGLDSSFNRFSGNPLSVLPWLIIAETLVLLVNRKKNEHFYSDGYFRVFGKIFIGGLYLLVIGLPVIWLGLNAWFAIPVIISFRVLMDIREIILTRRKQSVLANRD